MTLQENKVYNMDCLDLMQEMYRGGHQADCLLTDIPYDGVNRNDNGLRTLTKGNADIITFDLNKFLDLADKVVSGVFMIFCEFRQFSFIAEWFANKGYTVRTIVWNKTNPSPMNGEYVYLSGVELCVYAKKKGGTFNARCKNTVFNYPCGINEIHPTQKPLPLWYELLKDNTNEGQLVLDTCMGSFTTAIACHRLGRRFIGAELDKDYYDKGQARLQAELSQVSMFD